MFQILKERKGLSMNSCKGVMFIFQNIIVTVARKQTATSQFAPHTLETVFRRCMLKGMRFEIQLIIQCYKCLRILYHNNYKPCTHVQYSAKFWNILSNSFHWSRQNVYRTGQSHATHSWANVYTISYCNRSFSQSIYTIFNFSFVQFHAKHIGSTFAYRFL